MVVIGVVPFAEDKTCFSGQTCLLDGIQGQHLSEYDLWLPMDTCGVPNQVISAAGRLATINTTNGSLSSSSISWGSAALSLSAGQYRLCWCSGEAPCRTSAQFLADVGQFHILGPLPLQFHTCVSGQTCVVEGLAGLGWDMSDEFLIMDTCGQNQAGPRARSRLKPLELSQLKLRVPTTLKATPGLSWTGAVAHLHGSLVTVSWGQDRVLALGGSYRLCWCPGMLASVNSTNRSSNCITSDFAADAGELFIVGPTRQQEWTCISGQQCSLVGLDAGAAIGDFGQLLVLDTCGVGGLLHRWPDAGRLAQVATGSVSSSLAVSSEGGRYRLCWCAALPYPEAHCLSGSVDNQSSCEFYTGNFSDNSSLPCQTAEDFVVDAGTLDLLGPSPLYQHMTCFSGQACQFHDLEGYNLGLSRVMVLDTCGTTSLPARLKQTLTTGGAWASSDITLSGGVYRLCWCMETNSSWQSCALAEDFLLDAGTLTITGLSPLTQDRTCVSGRQCTVNNLQGFALHDASFYVLIMDTCGADNAALKWVPPAELSRLPQGFASRFELAVTAVGGEYRMCWCSRSNHTSESQCSQSGHFEVDAGGLFLVGPRPLEQDRTCITGQTCVLESLIGVGWSDADIVAIRSTCGSSQAEAVVERFMQETPRLADMTGGNWLASWDAARSSAAGGQYRLCWQAGLQLNGTESVAESWIDMGSFTLIGPSAGAARTCLSGQSCQVDGLLGQYLSANDSFVVMDTCSLNDSLPDFFVLSFLVSLTTSG